MNVKLPISKQEMMLGRKNGMKLTRWILKKSGDLKEKNGCIQKKLKGKKIRMV